MSATQANKECKGIDGWTGYPCGFPKRSMADPRSKGNLLYGSLDLCTTCIEEYILYYGEVFKSFPGFSEDDWRTIFEDRPKEFFERKSKDKYVPKLTGKLPSGVFD